MMKIQKVLFVVFFCLLGFSAAAQDSVDIDSVDSEEGETQVVGKTAFINMWFICKSKNKGKATEDMPFIEVSFEEGDRVGKRHLTVTRVNKVHRKEFMPKCAKTEFYGEGSASSVNCRRKLLENFGEAMEILGIKSPDVDSVDLALYIHRRKRFDFSLPKRPGVALTEDLQVQLTSNRAARVRKMRNPDPSCKRQ